MQAIALSMPPDIRCKLDETIAGLREQYDDVLLERVWLNEGGYWRARLSLNGVSTRWFYREARGRWSRDR